MLMNKGPNTDPCGIPIFKSVGVDIVDLIEQIKFCFEDNVLNGNTCYAVIF